MQYQACITPSFCDCYTLYSLFQNFLSFFFLQANLIRHTVNKVTFSEQCYYVFGDLSSRRMRGMNINDIEGSEEDTLAPLASTAGQPQMGELQYYFNNRIYSNKRPLSYERPI